MKFTTAAAFLVASATAFAPPAFVPPAFVPRTKTTQSHVSLNMA
jgi:hypothetical protein